LGGHHEDGERRRREPVAIGFEGKHSSVAVGFHEPFIKGSGRSLDDSRAYWRIVVARHYLHGDYLEAADRRPGSTVYCAFCDGYCLPEHLYDEHELDQSLIRLSASKRVLYRSRQEVQRPVDAANYFDGTADPLLNRFSHSDDYG
jgi:hypothetical protein